MTEVNQKKSDKIPVYAKDYKNEYLFIRGINKECERFFDRWDDGVKIFSSPQAKKLIYYFNKFLKSQERGKLKDISNFKIKEKDVKFIDYFEIELDYYGDLFYYNESRDRIENINEYYEMKYKELLESYTNFKNELKVDYLSDVENYYKFLNTDSDSDSDSD